MAQTIKANDLKTNLNDETSSGGEVIITVRGKNKYVVLSIEKSSYVRELPDTAAG